MGSQNLGHVGRSVEVPFPPRGNFGPTLTEPRPLPETYRNQRIRTLIGDQLTDLVIAPVPRQLRATGPGCPSARPRTAFPFPSEVYVVGCWSPSALVTRQEVPALVGRASKLARILGLQSEPVTSLDPEGRWVEAGLLLQAADLAAARKLARKLDQDYLVRWAPDGVEVVSSDPAQTPTLRAVWQLIRVGTQRCPMLIGSGARRPCQDPGGPWVGASIHLSAFWAEQRRVAIALMGCATCDSGNRAPWLQGGGVMIGSEGSAQISRGGGGVLVSRAYLPTRTRDWTTESRAPAGRRE